MCSSQLNCSVWWPKDLHTSGVIEWCFCKLTQGPLTFIAMFISGAHQSQTGCNLPRRTGKHCPKLILSVRLQNIPVCGTWLGLSTSVSIIVLASKRWYAQGINKRGFIEETVYRGEGKNEGHQSGMALSSFSQKGQWR